MLTCHRRAFSPPRERTAHNENHQQVVSQTLLKPSKKDAMSSMIEPHENDVLMGRGGKNNQHIGNEKLREVARGHCQHYSASSKKGKSLISRDIVRHVRNLDPPGRFLRRNQDNGLWEDVGDEVAREKASQVLRDAVAQQMGPLAAAANRGRVKESDSEVRDAAARSDEFPSHYSPTPSHYRHPDYNPEPVQSNATWPMETPSASNAFPASSPPYLPVTPVSVSQSRKRSRHYDSSYSPYSYDHRDIRYRPAHYMDANTPAYHHREQHYHHPGYYMGPHNANRIPPSDSRGRSHYTPMAARHSGAAISDDTQSPRSHQSHEFDLFNGELLSDQSDREGALPPPPSPYRHGYHRDHHDSI